MKKQPTLALLALSLLLSCSKNPEKRVITEPESPVWGESFKVLYLKGASEQLPQRVFLVARFYFDKYDSSIVIEMERKDTIFSREISVPEKSNLIQIKFVTDEGKDDLGKGMGWLFPVKKNSEELSPGALRTLGEVYERGMGWEEGNREKAREIYKRALRENPDDPLLLEDILRLKLDEKDDPELRDSARSLADLLLNKEDANSVYAAIALFTVLKDTEKIREASTKFLSLFSEDKRAPEVDLSLAFLVKPKSNEEWKEKIETFYRKYPNYLSLIHI